MRSLLATSLGVMLSLICSASWAASCTLTSSGIAFGGYDPFVPQDVLSVANIGVTCDETTAYSIALSSGAGTYEQRFMTSGLHQLLYNLYIDATLNTVWGDGTGHTAVVGDTQSAAIYTVYGRIPARQNAHVGAYGDTIVITLTF